MRSTKAAVTLTVSAVLALAGAGLATPARAATTTAPRTGGLAVDVPPDIDVAGVQTHLAQLNTIATDNGGTRRSGTAGYTQSVAYLKGRLQAAGYTVAEQTCTACTYRATT